MIEHQNAYACIIDPDTTYLCVYYYPKRTERKYNTPEYFRVAVKNSFLNEHPTVIAGGASLDAI